MNSPAFRWILAILLVSLPASFLAQPSLYEIEPNDTPAEATQIGGEVIVIGTLKGQDQDGYNWTVSDVDAQKRWNFELQGVPGRLTILEVIRVVLADNGVDVAGTERLFKMGTRDGSVPSVHEDLIFEPGEYILGVAGSGGGGGDGAGLYRPPVDSIKFDDEGLGAPAMATEPGGYRLAIREGGPLPLEGNPGDRSTKETSHKLRLNSETAAYLGSEETWYLMEITDKHTGQRWDVTGQIPVGRKAQATLIGVDGSVLIKTEADSKGRFSFPDLSLAKGSYPIVVKAKDAGYIRAVRVQSAGQRIEGAEAEPNDNWKLANRTDLVQPLTGRMGRKGESDFFLFNINEPLTDQVLTLKLETEAEHKFTFCLLDNKGARVQCRSEKGSIELVDLVLLPGSWGLEVSRGPEAAEYTVTLNTRGAIQPGIETEPNDDIERAATVPTNNRIKGRFSGRQEDDFFKLIVTHEPQLWRIQVIGDQVHELAYHDASGHQTQVYRIPAGQRRVVLENVYLLPGIHHVRVTGREGGTYTLLARPIGPPDRNGEFEPNDDTSRMQALRFEQTRTGLLQDEKDQDNYRFSLGNWDRIRISIEAPADGAIKADLYWDGSPFKEFNAPVAGQKVELEGLFPPGKYRINLYASKVSDAEYKLSLERLDRFDCPTDCEPNDNIDFASPFPADHIIEGRANEWRDSDWYAMPVFEKATEVALTTEVKRDIQLVPRGYNPKSIVTWDNESSAWRGTIPAGIETYLKVSGSRELPYRFEVSFSGGPEARPTPPDTPLKLNLDLEANEVSAYRTYGQQVKGSLSLANNGPTPLKIDLSSATSDLRWHLELEQTEVSIPTSGKQSIALTLHVPADTWADWPVRISTRAITESGGMVEDFVEISSGRDTPPVNPVHWSALPEKLRGGFNVAREVLGGRWTGEKNTAIGSGFPYLFDGMAVENQGVTLRGGTESAGVNVIVELAGGKPVDVVGLTLNSLSNAKGFNFLSNVDFALSMDGETFTPLVEEDLLPIRSEQAFVLEQSVPARFARLQLKHGFSGGSRGGVSLGEFKVIAKPGFDVSAGKGFNIADPAFGGHVVRSRPQISSAGWDRAVLTSEEENPHVRPRQGEPMEFVVGFHHDRAAQITRLQWKDSSESKEAARLESVEVSVSLDSPLGPWHSVGDWKLPADGGSTSFELDSPIWARFVRISAAGIDEFKWRAWPDTLQIWELPTDDEYRSILTEWGHASQSAIYEALHPLQMEKPFEAAGHDSKVNAATLEFDQLAGGQVVLGKHEHWYKMKVPSGQNILSIEVGGDPTVRTVVHLENSDGNPIPVAKLILKSTPQLHTYEAIVEPDQTYYLKIEEPPRNVAFLWDTSASVGAYLPVIYNALMAYAEDLVPGRDAANLIPFGGDVLLKDWYGDPYIMQTILNDYPRKENSSEAESTLYTASKALAPRAGTKAIVMVTDAATGRYGPVWDEFDRVQPRIFALGVGSQGAFGRRPVLEQDLMQDWSRVNGGHYSYLINEGEMEVAFDRAATMLRRPAGYSLEVGSSYRKAPGPGTLQVIAEESTTVTGGAVELILDASGSMLKRLDGKRRIVIAKEVLSEAVNDHIPPGTHVALRVFGHKEPNSCRTDLEIPLTPLDPASASKRIQAVNAMNLAKTPIADSLAKVESDLKNAPGPKVIVLVTDGEETCEGNPEEVIQKLQDKGIDITLNIVGFAIDDATLEAQFKSWAGLGGGRYFSANSQAGLSESLMEALQIPYAVYDSAGTLVAEGVVGGEPQDLEQGFYRVVVKSSPTKTFEKIEVSGEKHVEVRLN
jgi:von Willebrand factor type A domain